MTQRTDTISITDEAASLDAGYFAIASKTGWKAEYTNAQGDVIPNPITAQEAAVAATKNYWKTLITQYNVEIAQAQATEAAIAAVDAATGETTVTLTTGE
jgi:hypothetical protein